MTSKQHTRLAALAVQLTSRDQRVLADLARLRLMSTSHLQALHYPAVVGSSAAVSLDNSGRLTRKHLARLARLGLGEPLGLVRGGPGGGSKPMLWRLTPEGKRLTAFLAGEPVPARRTSYLPGLAHQTHTLAITELYVQLTAADRFGGLELLEHQAEPACWRSYVGAGGGLCWLRPDTFLRLGSGDWEELWFVEIDLGTEGTSALQRKLTAYQRYYQSGAEQQASGTFPRILWLTTTDLRARQLTQLFHHQPLPFARLHTAGLITNQLALLKGETT